MFTKYEELKIAASILGTSMRDACDADMNKIRYACMNPNSKPELIKTIDAVIEKAENKFEKHLEYKTKAPSY